uniref:Nesprin-1 n=1 Tax=Zeugodacus cucurbitae TaxID=28588 RepID=A0A0A1XH25_ZEUCU
MTSEINTNRLNLPNMVDRQLKEVSLPVETYFSPNILAGKRKVPEEKPFKAEISASFNDIVASVHHKLRNRKARKVEKPEISEEKLPNETPAEKPPENLSNVKSEMVETKADPKASLPKAPTPLKATSIPQIKAARAQKQQQRMRRTVHNFADCNDPISYRRLLEVQKQKRILEEMLIENERMDRDRQSMALEIQALREYMNDLGHKLDSYSKRLSTKSIIRNDPMLKPKLSLKPQPLNGVNCKKALSPIRKVHAPQSILKNTNSTSKSTNQTINTAKSPVRNNRSPIRNSVSPSRITKR